MLNSLQYAEKPYIFSNIMNYCSKELVGIDGFYNGTTDRKHAHRQEIICTFLSKNTNSV